MNILGLTSDSKAYNLKGNALRIKNLDERNQIFKDLEAAGYKIKPSGLLSPRSPTWFAVLDASRYRFGQCNSCQKLISMQGIESDGHVCELCGNVTYLEVVDDESTIRFTFNSSPAEDPFIMKIKKWDRKKELLYLYPEFLGNNRHGVLSGEEASKLMKENSDKWETVTEDGQTFMVFKYLTDQNWTKKTSVIEAYQITPAFRNYVSVKVWKDKVYRDFIDKFPVPEMIDIYI